MLNELVEGISMSLHSKFPDGYKIYLNDIEQGLQEPCFLIAVLNPTCKPMPGRRYWRDNPFCITYLPKCAGNNREMLETAERLIKALKVIVLQSGNSIRGSEIHFVIADGALQFFVNYNCFIVESSVKTKMQDLKTNVLKG